MTVTLEVLGAMGHRKYEKLTPEETQELISKIERGELEYPAGPYFVVDKETKRIIGKVAIPDNRQLVMLPIVRGG